MSKRLVFDARWIRTGIGRYVMNVLDGLKNANGFKVHALVRREDARELRPLSDCQTIVNSPIYGWREQLMVSWAARGADLLHVPHYNVPVLFGGRVMVTIHDLIHILDPAVSKTWPARVYARPMLHYAARRASRIITVSQFSKARIVEELGITEEKISVIYNGVHPRFRPMGRGKAEEKVRAALSLDTPYLLYVGNLKPHKNLKVLLRGFARLRARDMGAHRLVLLGEGAPWRRRLEAAAGRLGISDRVRFIPQVADDLLPSVYSASDLFIMPSLMEGFGFPVLEAMACGTPVACSRSSALPEVAGDAAHFFDPSSSDDLARAVERVLGDSGYRATLVKRGLDRARIFTWEECARNHRKLYAELFEA